MSALTEVSVKVSTIVLIALGAQLALQRRSAAARHWMLAVAVLCALAVPLLSAVAPAWDASRLARARVTATAPAPAAVPARVEDGSIARAGGAARATPRSFPPWPRLLVSVWAAGLLLHLLLLGVGLARLRRMASGARPIDGGRWTGLEREVAGTLGLRRAVTLLQSDDPARLVTWGIVRPRVLLPRSAPDWSDDRATVVLRHELAHIARGDWMWQVAAETLRALHWFNPLVWALCARLQQESEQACDDAVLAGGVAPHAYAAHLLDLARTLRADRRSRVPAPAMARPSRLEGRIATMLNVHVNRTPLTSPARLAVALALLALAVPIAGAQTAFYRLTGTALDPTDRPLTGATVTLLSPSRQATYQLQSDGAGRFAFVGLPAGDYVLTVSELGFKTTSDAVTIAGRDLDRTVAMPLGSLEETITLTTSPVAGNRPALSPEQQQQLQVRQERARAARQAALDRCASSGPDAAGGQILVTKKLTDAKPVYPEALKAAKQGGVVTMNATIGTDGSIDQIQVLASPDPAFSDAATQAVRQWRFSPTLLNCSPIDVQMTVTANFVVQP